MPMAPLSNYQDAVVDRYKSSDGTPDYERSWSYLDKILAREMGKAGGLLTFNAVLIAVAIAPDPWSSVLGRARQACSAMCRRTKAAPTLRERPRRSRIS